LRIDVGYEGMVYWLDLAGANFDDETWPEGAPAPSGGG
jgi:hypothetical protein